MITPLVLALLALPVVFVPESPPAISVAVGASAEPTFRTRGIASDTGSVFVVEELAEGVWAAVVRPYPSAYAFANSLVVEGPDGVLVVDTQQSQTAARALLERIRERTDAPVRWVVNTHWHSDHVNGNEVYRDAFPAVHFVAHAATRREMLTTGRERREEELGELPATIEERREWLETRTGPGGSALTEEQLAAVRRSLELRVAYLADLESLRETPPDVTFEEELTIHVGERAVTLRHLGAAHTPGDIVVQVPSAGVLAVGDILEEGPLWLEGADVPGWAEALAAVVELEGDVVLPSHGGVHRDRGLLELQAGFLGAAVALAREGLEAGTTEEAVVAGAPAALERFRSGFLELGLEGERFDEHAADAVREAWRDLRGGGAG